MMKLCPHCNADTVGDDHKCIVCYADYSPPPIDTPQRQRFEAWWQRRMPTENLRKYGKTSANILSLEGIYINHITNIAWEAYQQAMIPPREPTLAMQNAGCDATFDEGGDLKRRELLKIIRKCWRAMYDEYLKGIK